MHFISLAEAREGLEKFLNEKYNGKASVLRSEAEKDKMTYLESVNYADVAPIFDIQFDRISKEFNVFLWSNDRVGERLTALLDADNEHTGSILNQMIEALVGRIGSTNIADLVKKIQANLNIKYEAKDKSLFYVSNQASKVYVLTDSLTKAVAIVGDVISCEQIVPSGVMVDPAAKEHNLIKVSWSTSYGVGSTTAATKTCIYVVSDSVSHAWELFVNRNRENNVYVPSKELVVEKLPEKVIISG